MLRFAKWALLVMVVSITSCIAQPKLEIENGGKYDWGKVKAANSPLKAKMKLFNRGNDTLKIKEVKPGCGCTTAPLDKNNIEPGGFATLDISLNVGASSGPISKVINVESNDPTESRKVINLVADIYRPLIFFPSQYLNFGAMKIGEESIAKVVINNKSEKPVKITKIDFSPTNIKFTVKEGDVIPVNGDITLEVKHTPSVAGPLSVRITLYTDCPEAESVTVTGSGRVEADAPKVEAPATQTPPPSAKKK